MKKVILLVAVIATTFVSCGGDDKTKDGEEKKALTVCDCVNGFEDMQKEMEAAGEDEEKKKDIEEKYGKIEEECEKMGKDKSEEEMKKLMEEAEKCKH